MAGRRISDQGREYPRSLLKRLHLPLAALLLIAWVPGACAGVVLTFYSHDLRAEGREFLFPHAFVTLKGTTSSNQTVNKSFGFTAVTVSPALLSGPVQGHVTPENPQYIAASHPHFSVSLSDKQYRAVLAVVSRWRDRTQPSYNLNSQNCVTFVKEIAETVGLRAARYGYYIQKPGSFLDDLAGEKNAVPHSGERPLRDP
jgi:hypothetical protein